MASTPSIETLTRENMELYQELLLYRTEVRELEDMVDALKKKIRMLLDHIPAGALPAPKPFGDPRSIPGADSDGAAAAASAGGGHPPVARSVSSHGVVPSLGPSASVAEEDRSGWFPAITYRDAEGNLHVSLCPSPNCSSGLAVKAMADGWAAWVPREKGDE